MALATYLDTCPECTRTLPRAEFKRRGGGRNRLCRDCNRVRLASIRSERYYIESVKEHRDTLDAKFVRYVLTEALVEDYNDATELNRKRIKEMESSNNQTQQENRLSTDALAERVSSQESTFGDLLVQITGSLKTHEHRLPAILKAKGLLEPTSGISSE